MKPKSHIDLILLSITIMTISCDKTKNNSEEAFTIFNKGVSFSIEAINEAENGNIEKSIDLYNNAILKFHLTLEIDSTHIGALSSLGHSYYMINNYEKGMKWYEKSLKRDPRNAINYIELGFCQLNLGDLINGHNSVEKGLLLDSSEETKSYVQKTINDIGVSAFEYSKEFDSQGNTEDGQLYKEFSIATLLIAHRVDTLNIEVIKNIVDYSEQVGYVETFEEFKRKMK